MRNNCRFHFRPIGSLVGWLSRTRCSRQAMKPRTFREEPPEIRGYKFGPGNYTAGNRIVNSPSECTHFLHRTTDKKNPFFDEANPPQVSMFVGQLASIIDARCDPRARVVFVTRVRHKSQKKKTKSGKITCRPTDQRWDLNPIRKQTLVKFALWTRRKWTGWSGHRRNAIVSAFVC